jgi:two-component system CheB/CheR fusion protein
MKKARPTYRELEKRLAAAEPIVEALKHHEVDAVVGENKIAFLLLREVTEALLNSEKGFRAMFELPGVGMFQADAPSFCFTQVNQKLCKITGYSEKELLTKTYIGLTHPQDCRRDMNALTQLLRGKTDSWFIEKRCVSKDGKAIQVSVNVAVLRDDAGTVLKIVGMMDEITAPKSAREKTSEKPRRKGR